MQYRLYGGNSKYKTRMEWLKTEKVSKMGIFYTFPSIFTHTFAAIIVFLHPFY